MSGEFSGLGSDQQGHIEEYEVATVLHEASTTLVGNHEPQYLAKIDTRQQIQYINGVPYLYGEIFYSALASGATLSMIDPIATEALEIDDDDAVRCTFYAMRFDHSSDDRVLRNPRLELIVTSAAMQKLPRILAITHDVFRDSYSTITDERGMSQGQLEAAAQIARIVSLAERVEAEQLFYEEAA